MSFMVKRFLNAKDNKERKAYLRVMNHTELVELFDLVEDVDNLLDEIYG